MAIRPLALSTTIKHLTRLTKRLESAAIPKTERRAIAEAIAWLTGERRRHIRLDLRDKMLDHLDGNIYNNDPSNLRVVTMKENKR